jgi:type IV pilus assembly protein PilM
MDEKSIWKRELSFRRKPKASKPEASDGDKKSIWKQELSFRRKPKVSKREASEVDKKSVWKRELSFRKRAEQPVVAETPVESRGGTSKPVWRRELSFRRKPKGLALERSEKAVETKPSLWRREIVLGRKQLSEQPSPIVEPAIAPELVQTEVVTPAPVVIPEPAPASPSEPAHAETWDAAPEVPPAPAAVSAEPFVPHPAAADEPTVEQAPPAETIVHPPVPAAQLPPLAAEPEDGPRPFWRRELVFGRRGPAKAKAEPSIEPTTSEKQKRQKPPKGPKIKVDRGGKGKKIVGLKVGASQLAAARVTNNGAAELLQVAREPLSPGVVVGGELRDPDALAIALKDFFGKYKLPKRGVRLGIANNRIGVRTFEIGGIEDAKQLDNAIRFRAQEALPIPIDQAVLDYHILGERTDEEGQTVKRVLLVVAYREQIDRYVDACKKAGIMLAGIDLEAFALLRAIQAPQTGVAGDQAAALVAVAVGHERSTFAVSDGRVCEFTRVLEWGGQALSVAIARALDAAPSEVESVKRSLSLEDESVPEGLTPDQATRARDAARRAIQTFARELVSSLQFYQNQPGSLGIGEIVITGGTTHLIGLAEELERLIGVTVRVADPLARMKVSKRVGEPEQLGSYAVAIGLGIED